MVFLRKDVYDKSDVLKFQTNMQARYGSLDSGTYPGMLLGDRAIEYCPFLFFF